MADNYYPPVGFYFNVTVDGISGVNEGSFQEVSGLSVKLETTPVKEGGENQFVHRLPLPPVYSNIVLKRGLMVGSPLITWALSAVQSFTFTPKTVVITLMDQSSNILATWNVVNAYPVALKVSDLKAQENALAIDTLELAFQYFQRS